MTTRIILLVSVVMALKVLRNISRYLQTKRLLNSYIRWLAGEDVSLIGERSHFRRLIKGAGVYDATIGYAEPVGYGYMRSGSAHVTDNFPNNREDYFHICGRMLTETEGIYKRRIFETFNPLYWIDVIINLPREVLSYFGVSAENLITKIALVLWWGLEIVAGLIWAFYKPQAEELIKKWLARF